MRLVSNNEPIVRDLAIYSEIGKNIREYTERDQ